MLSTNVVSAKAASPSGAGFAIGTGVGPVASPARAKRSSPVMLAAIAVPPYVDCRVAVQGTPENEGSVPLLALAASRGRRRCGAGGLSRRPRGGKRFARRPRLGPAAPPPGGGPPPPDAGEKQGPPRPAKPAPARPPRAGSP